MYFYYSKQNKIIRPQASGVLHAFFGPPQFRSPFQCCVRALDPQSEQATSGTAETLTVSCT